MADLPVVAIGASPVAPEERGAGNGPECNRESIAVGGILGNDLYRKPIATLLGVCLASIALGACEQTNRDLALATNPSKTPPAKANIAGVVGRGAAATKDSLPGKVSCRFTYEKEKAADEKPSTYRRPAWRPKPIQAWRAAVKDFPRLRTEKAKRMLALINQLRKSRGLSTVVMEPRLMAAADRQSQDMAKHGHLSHTDSDGSHMEDRVDDVGYCYTKLAENIAATRETAEATFQQWVVSKRHLDQMTIPGFTHVGIAYAHNPARPRGGTHYRHYWTLLLGRPDPWAAGH